MLVLGGGDGRPVCYLMSDMMEGVSRTWGLSAPCLASLSSSPLPRMFVSALIFLMEMLWFEVLMV